MKRFILYLTAILLVASCSNTVVETELFDDGTVKSEKTFKKIDGREELVKEVTYHPNGNKSMEGTYKDGLKEGHWVSWYDNGVLWSEGDFRDGESHGLRKVYHPNGTLYYEGNFDMGNRVGVWHFYDDAGNLEKETDYGSVEQQK